MNYKEIADKKCEIISLTERYFDLVESYKQLYSTRPFVICEQYSRDGSIISSVTARDKYPPQKSKRRIAKVLYASNHKHKKTNGRYNSWEEIKDKQKEMLGEAFMSPKFIQAEKEFDDLLAPLKKEIDDLWRQINGI